MKQPALGKRQVAALSIRITDDGEINVLLVSSRETRRWVIPKGWPSKKISDAKAAAREAREEAGVTGKVYRKPVGDFCLSGATAPPGRASDADAIPTVEGTRPGPGLVRACVSRLPSGPFSRSC
jgi:8-oxo-dGTP pyrophosphatase MutT (NUDIX family)